MTDEERMEREEPAENEPEARIEDETPTEQPAEEMNEGDPADQPDAVPEDEMNEEESVPSAQTEEDGEHPPDEPSDVPTDESDQASEEQSTDDQAGESAELSETPTADEEAAGASGPNCDIYKAIVESLLFASSKPIPLKKFVEVINDSAGGRVDSKLIRNIIEQLRNEYDEQGRAFQIEEIAEGFQALTRPEYHEWVRALAASRQQPRLSPAAVETLAIVAYKQPVSRAKVDDIRGVQCGPMLRTLMEKRLIKVVGREEVPGRPLLYGTTKEFLEHFGLKTVKDLPSVKELPDLSG